MTPVLDGPRRCDAQLDLLFTDKKELLRDVIINGSIGLSHHEIVELQILRVKKMTS